jgi:hypothetical protein
LFSANEIVHMVPIAGGAIYEQMLASNGWSAKLLPNAGGQARRFDILPVDGYLMKNMAERLLNTPPGRWLEHWEMSRKIAKLRRQHHDQASDEVVLTADRCQGHFDQHGRRTLEAFQARLRQMGRGTPYES